MAFIPKMALPAVKAAVCFKKSLRVGWIITTFHQSGGSWLGSCFAGAAMDGGGEDVDLWSMLYFSGSFDNAILMRSMAGGVIQSG
jgi:hypothetical protein